MRGAVMTLLRDLARARAAFQQHTLHMILTEKQMTDTLADALPREIARVTAKKERWIGYMRDHDMGPGMQFSINIMAAEIDEAIKACATGDVVAMMAALESLRGYSDDD
jgi:hypothetical protein